MRRFFYDLFYSPQGRVSHTKFWANIAYLVASYAVLAQAYKGSLTYDMLGIYLGAVAVHGAANKVTALKYRTPSPSTGEGRGEGERG